MGLRFQNSISEPQKEIYVFDKELEKQKAQNLKEKNYIIALENIKASLVACGKWAKHEILCNKCDQEGNNENLLEVTKQIHLCEMRLCDKPLCVSLRYARAMEAFESVKRLDGLNKLNHFSIGFEKISKEEFEENFDYHKKRQERVMSAFFKKLKIGHKAPDGFRVEKYIREHPKELFFDPINIQGFRVLDISKGKKINIVLKASHKNNKGKPFFIEYDIDKGKRLRDEFSASECEELYKGRILEKENITYSVVDWNEEYYIHYHFATIPTKKQNYRTYLKTMNDVCEQLKKNQRVKIPFSFENHGLKEKKSCLSYLAIRLIGLYKKHETNKDDIQDIKNFYNAKDIKKSLVDGKWITLNKLVSTEQYLKHFYKKRNLSTIGNSYFCFNCKKQIPLKTNGKPTYEKDVEKICPYCSSSEVKLAMPKSLRTCTSSDIVVWIYCKHHGKFRKDDHFNLIHRFEILEYPPPPEIQLNSSPRPISTLVHATRRDVCDCEGNLLRSTINHKTYEQKRELETGKVIIKKKKYSFVKNTKIIVEYVNPKTMEPFSEGHLIIRELTKISNLKINKQNINEIKRTSKIKYTGFEGDYNDFGIEKINLERFKKLDHKERLVPLPPLEDFECNDIKEMRIKLRSGQSLYEFNKFQEEIRWKL